MTGNRGGCASPVPPLALFLEMCYTLKREITAGKGGILYEFCLHLPQLPRGLPLVLRPPEGERRQCPGRGGRAL